MIDWAEQECRIACKRENPDYDFDSDAFDYGCSCYKSALKAYKSLCEDGHSGASFGFTKNILIKLMNSQPLTPITDEDFFSVERGSEIIPLESPEYLQERGLKSELQCPRMYSLFRSETLDGKVSYRDINRAYHVNIEEPSDTYSTSDEVLDDMFPITMPYVPTTGKYKIYEQTFLVDKKHGDFDTRGIIYIETPDGERIDVNKYMTEDDVNGGWKDITKEEYNELLSRRIDKLNKKIAKHLIWTLISNSSDDEERKRREAAYAKRDKYLKNNDYMWLNIMCEFFNNPDNYKYNTFDMHQALCRGRKDAYKDIPELERIAGYLSCILVAIHEDK